MGCEFRRLKWQFSNIDLATLPPYPPDADLGPMALRPTLSRVLPFSQPIAPFSRISCANKPKKSLVNSKLPLSQVENSWQTELLSGKSCNWLYTIS